MSTLIESPVSVNAVDSAVAQSNAAELALTTLEARLSALEASCVDALYEIPSCLPPKLFEKGQLTNNKLQEAMAASSLMALLQPRVDSELASPPLALKSGHVGLLLASGMLNGVVKPPDEPPHLVRGIAGKTTYKSSVEETTDDDGRTTCKTTYSERMTLRLRLAWPDGSLQTLAQDTGDKE